MKIIPRDSVQNVELMKTDVSGFAHISEMLFVFIEDDLVLDWYEGHNWVTVEMFDSNVSHLANSSMSTVKLVDFNQSNAWLMDVQNLSLSR